MGGSKITADCNCSHEIKRHLLLARKAMTNLDSILKSKDITLPTKVHPVKARRHRSAAERSYPMSKVGSSGLEETPHVQGKEQRLCFAGAAVKGYPTSKVRETQVRR